MPKAELKMPENGSGVRGLLAEMRYTQYRN
jgi:hypothetical protein